MSQTTLAVSHVHPADKLWTLEEFASFVGVDLHKCTVTVDRFLIHDSGFAFSDLEIVKSTYSVLFLQSYCAMSMFSRIAAAYGRASRHVWLKKGGAELRPC